MNRNYELVVILDPELEVEGQEKLLEKIKQLVTEPEGEVAEIKKWGKKELAYPILKKRAGFFVEIKLSVPREAISSLKQKLQLEKKILRYLLVVEERRPA